MSVMMNYGTSDHIGFAITDRARTSAFSFDLSVLSCIDLNVMKCLMLESFILNMLFLYEVHKQVHVHGPFRQYKEQNCWCYQALEWMKTL